MNLIYIVADGKVIGESLTLPVDNRITLDDVQYPNVDSITYDGTLDFRLNEYFVTSGTVTAVGILASDELKLAKCKLINDATQASILAIASTDKQRNYLAKYNELLEKKFDATITADEIGQMAYLKSVWLEIENLVTAGNAKEALVNACVSLAEIEAVVI